MPTENVKDIIRFCHEEGLMLFTDEVGWCLEVATAVKLPLTTVDKTSWVFFNLIHVVQSIS